MRSAFFSEGIRKPAGMILTENLLVDGFRSLCRSLIHVRRMECAKRKLTGFLCLIHIILHIWDRFGQSLGVAANSVFRSRRSLRAPACWAAAAGIRMLPHHLVRIPFPSICGRESTFLFIPVTESGSRFAVRRQCGKCLL